MNSTADNILSLGAGIDPSQIVVASDGDGDVILTDGTTGDRIQIDGMLSRSRDGVQEIAFADGNKWSSQDIRTMAARGSSSNTSLIDTQGGITLDPNGYAHLVSTYGGNDTILYGLGYGSVEINQRDSSSSDINVLHFGSGISLSDVTASGDGRGNVILKIGSGADIVQLDGMLSSANDGVQLVKFADGAIWSATDLIAQVPASEVSGSDYYQTITFNKGDSVNQAQVFGNGEVDLGSSIAEDDVYVQADAAGDLIIRLMDDSTDSLVLENDLGGDSSNLHSRIGKLVFSNGDTLDLSTNLASTWIGSATNHALTGVNGIRNIFDIGSGGDQIVAGNNGNTFVFGKGDGHSTVVLNGNVGTVEMSSGISSSDVGLESTSSGDLIVQILDTGETITFKNDLLGHSWGVSSQISAVKFSDGTSVDLTSHSGPSFTWIGTGSGAPIVGSAFGSNIFVAGPNNAAIVAGNGSDPDLNGKNQNSASSQNTIYFERGDGAVTVNDNGANVTVILDSSIHLNDLSFGVDIANNEVLSVGSTGDQITFSNADAAPLIDVDYNNQQLAVKEATSSTNPNLYGGSEGDVFESKGIATYEQGYGGNDTFIYNAGYGHLEINESSNAGDQSVLQMGAGLTATDIAVTSDNWGDLFLTDGTAGDRIELDNVLSSSNKGPQLVTFTDGSSLTQTQLIDLATTGTTAADSIYGQQGKVAQTFDGKGAPSGSQDYVQGYGGNDTFIYNAGYGHLEINESSNAGDQSVLQMGAGLTATDIRIASSGSNPSDAQIYDARSGDTVTLDDLLSSSLHGPQAIKFVDGSSVTRAQIVSDAQSSQAFSAASGNVTLRSNATSLTVTGDTGSENLWFQQQSQDLLVEIIGSRSVMRVSDWFSGNSSLASIVTTSGQQIDGADLRDIVAEMVDWSKGNSAFNAASASSLPTDDGLQSAVQRDWQETQGYGS